MAVRAYLPGPRFTTPHRSCSPITYSTPETSRASVMRCFVTLVLCYARRRRVTPHTNSPAVSASTLRPTS